MYLLKSAIWIIVLLACIAGVFVKLPIFGRSRLLALVLLPFAFVVGGIMVGNAPPEVRAEQERQEAAKRGTYDDVYAHPERYLDIEYRSENNLGFVSISGTLSNSSAYPIKDAKLKCTVGGESGTHIGGEKLAIYKRVPPNGKVKFKDVSVGPVSSQATSLVCRIVDASAGQS